VDGLASVLTIIFIFHFGQLFQSDSRATLKILVIFVSVLPWPTLAVMRTFKYVSKELFQSFTKMVQWLYFSLIIALAPVLIVGSIGLNYFNYF
jgi:hypothetical protein